jgi:hypothetical protein
MSYVSQGLSLGHSMATGRRKSEGGGQEESDTRGNTNYPH